MCHHRPANTALKDCPITRLVKVIIAATAAAGLCACQPRGGDHAAAAASQGAGRQQELAYRPPPVLGGVLPVGGGRVRLFGRAAPGARVRLTSPAGPPLYVDADGQGAWRLDLPWPGQPRLLGLAMIDGGRVVQSEGYIALTPGGGGAQLRAGAGAVVLGDRAAGPVIDAVDYDAKGGTVVSGRGARRASVEIFVDGARQARGRSDADGLFYLALDEPQTFADHDIDVVEGDRRARVRARLAAAPPLTDGPYRAVMTPLGWRIDWATPGGGVQTTLLLARQGGVS